MGISSLIKNKAIWLIIIFIILMFTVLLIFRYQKQVVNAEIWTLKYFAQPIRLKADLSLIVKKELHESISIPGERVKNRNWWYLLKLTDNKQVKYFQFNTPEKLYSCQDNVVFKTSESLQKILKNTLLTINRSNPFGQLIPWEEGTEIFPRMAKAKIRDLETGLTLNIQRRAGSSHADVQPLKASDTEIIKQVYGGRWSWKRRAIIVEKNGYKIAASMNGMPHGQGAIQGNNFPGHFCIHFLNSKTHSGNLDLAHQLMVWKAAGLIDDYLAARIPREMVEIALVALAQNDLQLVTLSFNLNYDLTSILDYMNKIASLKIHSIEDSTLANSFLVKIEWYELTTGKNYKREVVLNVEKVNGQYLVNPTGLIRMLTEIINGKME